MATGWVVSKRVAAIMRKVTSSNNSVLCFSTASIVPGGILRSEASQEVVVLDPHGDIEFAALHDVRFSPTVIVLRDGRIAVRSDGRLLEQKDTS